MPEGRVPLDDIQAYNVLIGPQRTSVAQKRQEERARPLDPETIERRVQRSRNAILAKRDKARLDATSSADARTLQLQMDVAKEREDGMYFINKNKEEALLKLQQMYAKEEALIESTFVMRQTEYDLIAQQWTFQAESNLMRKQQQEEDRHQQTEKLSLAEQMLKEDRENLKYKQIKEAQDDPLRVLGMRTRMPGDPFDEPASKSMAAFGGGQAAGITPEDHAEVQKSIPVPRRALGAMVGSNAITATAEADSFDPAARRAERLKKLDQSSRDR